MNDLDLCLEVVSKSCQELREIRRWISRKPLEIEAWFQRTTNRKWYMGYQMVTWSMTSRDPQRCCKAVRLAILATAWLLVVFLFVIVLIFVRFSHCNFLFLYRFRFTNCHNSRFHTHRMTCNNSSFRFRYENSSDCNEGPFQHECEETNPSLCSTSEMLALVMRWSSQRYQWSLCWRMKHV